MAVFICTAARDVACKLDVHVPLFACLALASVRLFQHRLVTRAAPPTAHGPDRAGTLKAHPKTSYYELSGREESGDAHGHLETAWPGAWPSAAAAILLLPCFCPATLVGGRSSVSTRACSSQPGERGGSHPDKCNGFPIPACRLILFFVFFFLILPGDGNVPR